MPIDPRLCRDHRHARELHQREPGESCRAWIDTTSYSTPIYTVPASQPSVPVIISSDNTPLRAAMAAVPVPADAQPAAGTDEEMTIYQASTDTLWERCG